ncbi:MAG: right-handed parallel beta-helix repeat-containing protein [Candidatus Dependentiae bacterium]
MKQKAYFLTLFFITYSITMLASPAGTRLWDITASIGPQFVTIESKLETISVNEVDFSGVFTALDALQKEVCTVDSLVDVFDTLVIDAGATTGAIDKKLDDLAQDFDETWTILAALNLKAKQICTSLENAESNIDNADITVALDFSGIFTAIEASQQKACTINSKVETINNQLENIDIDISGDLSGTFTLIDAIEEKVQSINDSLSVIDAAANIIGIPISDADLPLSISSSGFYYATEDLSGNIEFDTSGVRNVVLDLNGFTLTGRIFSSSSGGVEGLIIQNGRIKYSEDDIIIDFFNPSAFANVIIRDLHIINTGGVDTIRLGSLSNAFLFENVIIKANFSGINTNNDTVGQEMIARNCFITATIGTAFATALRLENCIAKNSGRGFFFRNVNASSAQNCKATNCSSSDGFSIRQSSNIVNCISKLNSPNGFNLSRAAAGITKTLQNNISSANSSAGINLTSSANSPSSELVKDNICLFNSTNINQTGTGNVSLLGNFTLNTTTAGNRTLNNTSTTTFSNQVQGVDFTTTSTILPTRWNNISMTI